MDTEEPLRFDGTDPLFWQDVHTPLREAREAHPLARLDLPRGWVVLRHADVERLLGDRRLVSAYDGVVEGPVGRVLRGFLLSREGADHARLRALVVRAFTPRRVDEVRPFIRATVERLLAALPYGEPFDFQRAVADRLTVAVIARIIGVPSGDEEVFGRWTGEILAGASPLADPAAQATAASAAVALEEYLGKLAARRRRAPGDDLLDALITAESEGQRLSEQELRDMVMSLLIGGHDTVRSFLTIATWLVLEHAALARLRAEPALIASAVEEALRFEPPLLSVARRAREPLFVGGRSVMEGEMMFLNLAAANRDPHRFPEPDHFDVAREANAHLAFGRGTHFCVGAALARLEGRELLTALASTGPTLDLVEHPRWVPFSPSRRLAALHVQRI